MRFLPTILLATAISTPALAQDCISTELALVADVSSSMSSGEREIQRAGYASAFRSGEVFDAIQNSYCGAIAVAYIEFGSTPHIIADWFVIQTDEDAEYFAQEIEAAETLKTGPSGTLTGLARAIRFAGESLDANGITADRSVMDVSADGGDNIENGCTNGKHTHNAVQIARDELTTPSAENGWREVVINALPIVGGQNSGTCGMSLTDYMDEFVRGGAGSFLMEANGVSDLPRIVREKLAQEIG
ncbi:DUF1194 domain-containing protein [uncultured Roseibium sp.]|uniref:DUF1194 domain-containing protein n=1 Tax=uncultured Roseibium sp. TaxID=1936171 RepID=UPI00261B1F58|nr:DUF1194 domain-containing protein [uncultured Roseibium sp.]